jgi:hypothetical protein
VIATGEEEIQEEKEVSDEVEEVESDPELTTGQQEEERNIGDSPGVILTDVDKLMGKVLGDCVNHNDGTHLDGGISSDTNWKDYWKRLIVFPGQKYNLLKGKVGKRFIFTLAAKVEH